jgi:2-polyprenyl-3-methyl-5-hydroxy-6-metoxy-1,4-benzoquinol methylase
VESGVLELEKYLSGGCAHAVSPRCSTGHVLPHHAAGDRPGLAVLEVGVGGGSVTGWLSKRVGDTGRVVATDVDAGALASSRGVNVEVLRHDLGAEEAPRSGFDLVHARLVLEH